MNDLVLAWASPREIAAIVLVAIGVAFDVFGCIGLVRLPDVYNRLQASTKCVTVGTCLIVAGSLIGLGTTAGAIKGLICLAFILLTSPTAAHALAKAAHRSGLPMCEESVIDRYAEDRDSRPGQETPS